MTTNKVRYLKCNYRTGIIKDNTGKTYTVSEARELIKERGNSLSLSFTMHRLRELSWSMALLKQAYQNEN